MTLRHPPGDAGEPQGRRRAPTFVSYHQAGPGFDCHPDDDDDDDRESNADGSSSDKWYICFLHYRHDRFPYRKQPPLLRRHRVVYSRSSFSTSEASSSVKPTLTLYPRVDEILGSCADRARSFAKESKPLHRILPFKRKSIHVTDTPVFCVDRYLDPDFSRITKQKSILNLSHLRSVYRTCRN